VIIGDDEKTYIIVKSIYLSLHSSESKKWRKTEVVEIFKIFSLSFHSEVINSTKVNVLEKNKSIFVLQKVIKTAV